MVKEKLLTRKQSSRNEESYFKQDIGEQMEKGSLKRFGELETFWAQCLCQGTQIAKSLLFSSPNLVLLLVLRGTSCLSPRGYCGLEIISGIKRTRPRLQLLQQPIFTTSLKQVPRKLVKNSDANSDAPPELSVSRNLQFCNFLFFLPSITSHLIQSSNLLTALTCPWTYP